MRTLQRQGVGPFPSGPGGTLEPELRRGELFHGVPKPRPPSLEPELASCAQGADGSSPERDCHRFHKGILEKCIIPVGGVQHIFL